MFLCMSYILKYSSTEHKLQNFILLWMVIFPLHIDASSSLSIHFSWFFILVILNNDIIVIGEKIYFVKNQLNFIHMHQQTVIQQCACILNERAYSISQIIILDHKQYCVVYYAGSRLILNTFSHQPTFQLRCHFLPLTASLPLTQHSSAQNNVDSSLCTPTFRLFIKVFK